MPVKSSTCLSVNSLVSRAGAYGFTVQQPQLARALRRRHFHGSSQLRELRWNEQVEDVAILGGGISGLATAFYLLKANPFTPITIYESSNRLGGWIRSQMQPLPDGGHVVFESGPRTIRGPSASNRANALCAWEMVHDLGMGDRVLYTAEKFPRYIFYDGQLQRLPQSIWEAVKATFTMPLFSSLPSAILQDMNTPARPPELKDETIESFITRRFGARIAEDFVSSLVHGIYAGNISELSVRSIFPTAWHLEGDLSQAGGKGGGIFAASMFKWLEKKLRPGARKSQSLRELLELTTEQSLVAKVLTNLPMDVPIPTGGLWSLDQGMETLVHQLERYLGQFGNVTILKNQSIRNITSHEKSVEISSENASSESKQTNHSHVVSTLPSNVIASLSSQQRSFSSDASTSPSSVSVAVANLYFGPETSHPALTNRPRGFGYLIPRSTPKALNPHGTLGVVFDSDVIPGTVIPPHIKPSNAANDARFAESLHTYPRGQNMTLIMGGHYWKGQKLRDEQEVLAAARETLEIQLGIPKELETLVHKVTVQRDCIPQYKVGHQEWVGRVQKQVKEVYGGRLMMAGGAYNGLGIGTVGVSDCIRGAREVVSTLMGPV